VCLHQGRDLPVRGKITIFFCAVQIFLRTPSKSVQMKKSLLCLFCLALTLCTLHGCKILRPAAKPELVADSAIASGVRGRIAEEGLPPVRVFVLDGRVTLSGSVPSQEIREKIIAVAKSVEGVLLVTADLQLQKIR